MEETWKSVWYYYEFNYAENLRQSTCKTIYFVFCEVTFPYQFAFQTRVGTDALAQVSKMFIDFESDRVVLSLDGIGVLDHVKRSVIMENLFDNSSTTYSNPLCAFVV